MRILLIHQYFCLPEEGGKIRSFHFASKLKEMGHEVVVIRGEGDASTSDFKIHNAAVSYSNTFKIWRRLWSFWRFYQKAKRLAIDLHQSQPFDLCFASSTPLSVGFLALDLKRSTGLRYIFEVRDLWPEAVFELLPIKNKWLQNYLLKRTRDIYQEADKVIALSPGMKDGISQIYGGQVEVIPNFANLSLFPGQLRAPEGEKLSIGYFGALSTANNVPQLLHVAKSLAENKFEIQIAGWGPGRDEVKRAAAEAKHIAWLGYLDKQQTVDAINQRDIILITFLPNPALEILSPNKFFDALAAGKMVIITIQGWLRDMVESNQCGIYLPPDKITHVNKYLEPFYQDRQKLHKYQQNAKLLARQFDKDLLTNRLVSLTEEAKVGSESR